MYYFDFQGGLLANFFNLLQELSVVSQKCPLTTGLSILQYNISSLGSAAKPDLEFDIGCMLTS